MVQSMLPLRANGKVLISGEYLVLQGAVALAVPLKLGQQLSMMEGNLPGKVEWIATDTTGTWFQGIFTLEDWTIIESSDKAVALRLQKMLAAVRSISPGFLRNRNAVKIGTTLEFNRNWGFGSSSSLIALLARLADIDALALHRLVSEGSGYDVACAVSGSALLFNLANGQAVIRPVDFQPPFLHQLFLVYLGYKQNSETEVVDFKGRNHNFTSQNLIISEISMKMATANDPAEFIQLMLQHELIMESLLERPSVMKLLFPDFQGAVKSLGAWGGDFVLAASMHGEAYVRNYFSNKSMGVVFPLNELAIEPVANS